MVSMTLEKIENINKTIQHKDDAPSIIKREKKMVEIMIRIYCNAKHKTNDVPCLKCSEFLEYVNERLDKCPYQAEKTACGKCGLSCYEPRKKENGFEVFNYSGPRMLISHPILAFHHLLDAFKEPKNPDAKN